MSCHFREEQALLSALPLVSLEKKLFERSKRNILTGSVAGCYPFTSFEMCDDNGILLGVNKHNNSLIIVDIFNSRVYKNANMAILGTSGAGKTFTMQLMALRIPVGNTFMYALGRLALLPERGLVLYSKDCIPSPSTLAAFWVLLDFREDITFHTASDFPVALTFYTQSDAYDVIHIPEEKEMLMNNALSAYKEDAPRRIAIVDHAGQIPLLAIPGTAAFCTVTPDGKVQYYRKQGVTDT